MFTWIWVLILNSNNQWQGQDRTKRKQSYCIAAEEKLENQGYGESRWTVSTFCCLIKIKRKMQQTTIHSPHIWVFWHPRATAQSLYRKCYNYAFRKKKRRITPYGRGKVALVISQRNYKTCNVLTATRKWKVHSLGKRKTRVPRDKLTWLVSSATSEYRKSGCFFLSFQCNTLH